MRSDVERTIMHYYPQRALVSPIDNDTVTWDWDPSYTVLKAILAQLEGMDPTMRPGTRASYDISEEVVLGGKIHLQLSYIGPYAAIDYGLEREEDDEDTREMKRRVEKTLETHGVDVLSTLELEEKAPWIQHGLEAKRPATVWQCLFLLPLP
jgi:hypothetical protein